MIIAERWQSSSTLPTVPETVYPSDKRNNTDLVFNETPGLCKSFSDGIDEEKEIFTFIEESL